MLLLLHLDTAGRDTTLEALGADRPVAERAAREAIFTSGVG